MSSRLLRSLSEVAGGRGVALKNQGPIALGPVVQLGRSPGPGTGCSLELATNLDGSYAGAIVNWYVVQFGHRALFAQTTLGAGDVATLPTLVQTQSGFAADYWELEMQLTGATTPAENLVWSVTAGGIEDIPQTTNTSAVPGLFFQASSTGPAQAGHADFTVPLGVTTWIVVVSMRITASGVDPVGDSASTEAVFAWKNVGGVVSIVPVALSAPNTSEDALMGTFVTAASATGAAARISWTTPTGLDASSVVLTTVNMVPIGVG